MNLRLLYKEKFERDHHLIKIDEEDEGAVQKEWNPMDGGLLRSRKSRAQTLKGALSLLK
jgi:hypothetical protein